MHWTRCVPILPASVLQTGHRLLSQVQTTPQQASSSSSLTRHHVVCATQASIISIAKRSTIGTSTHVAIDCEDVEVPWHAVETAEEVVEELASSSAEGLSQAEAARRCVCCWHRLRQHMA